MTAMASPFGSRVDPRNLQGLVKGSSNMSRAKSRAIRKPPHTNGGAFYFPYLVMMDVTMALRPHALSDETRHYYLVSFTKPQALS